VGKTKLNNIDMSKLIAIFVILLFSCNNSNSRIDRSAEIETPCSEKEVIKNLILCMINSYTFKEEYEHQKRDFKQKEIVFIRNSFIKDTLEFVEFNTTVYLLDKQIAINKGIKAYLEFTAIRFESDTVKLFLRYRNMGGELYFKMTQKDCTWYVHDSSFEYIKSDDL
jgi:hypothetical protein